MAEHRLHTFNWISLAAGHGFLRALAERISLQCRVCVTVLPGAAAVPATGWHRDSCQCRARPTPLLALPGHCTMCASLLRNWCISSRTRKFGAVVRRHGQGRSRRVQKWGVELPGVSPSAARHVTPRTASLSHLSSSGAVKQETFNSSAWSRAVGSGLRRRTRPPWRLRGGEAKTFRPPPPFPPPSLPSGRRRWRSEWLTSQQLWTWNSSQRTWTTSTPSCRTCTPSPTTWAGAASSWTGPKRPEPVKDSELLLWWLKIQADALYRSSFWPTVSPGTDKTF